MHLTKRQEKERRKKIMLTSVFFARMGFLNGVEGECAVIISSNGFHGHAVV